MLSIILISAFLILTNAQENPKVCLEGNSVCYTGSYRTTPQGNKYASFQGILHQVFYSDCALCFIIIILFDLRNVQKVKNGPILISIVQCSCTDSQLSILHCYLANPFLYKDEC